MDVTPQLRRRLDPVAWLAETVVILAIIANIVVTFSNTLLRYTTKQDLPWNQDISTIILSIITFLGAPSYFRRSSGMAYNALVEKAVGARRDALQACGLAIFLGVCCVALLAYPRFFASQRTQSLAVLGLSSVFVAVARHRPRAVVTLRDRKAARPEPEGRTCGYRNSRDRSGRDAASAMDL